MKQLPFISTDLTSSKAGFFCVLFIMVFNLEFLDSSWTPSRIGDISGYLSGSDFFRYMYWILKASVRKSRRGGQKKRIENRNIDKEELG